MLSPKIIGIVSVIPGVGFWLLRQYQRSIGAFILTMMFLSIAIASTHYLYGPISNSLWYITFVIWVGQIYFSADTAKLLNQQSTKKNERTKAPYQKGLTKNERFINNVWLTVKQELSPTEKLNAAVFGFYFVKRNNGINIQFPTRSLYLAITDVSFLIIETDFLGSPMTLKRIEKTEITSINLKQGFLNDTLLLCYKTIEDSNCMEMKISFRLREQTKLLASFAHI